VFAAQMCYVVVVPTAEDWYNKGVVLDKANRRFEEAVQCYDKALEIDPEYLQAWYGKEDALYLIGKCGTVLACLEEALLCFDKVLKLDPQNVAAAGRKQQTLKAIHLNTPRPTS
jgi:tetratricopeptide (TPR) repeat protein